MYDSEPFAWVEEHTGKLYAPIGIKRKARTKKMEFVGWGSRPLIEFLETIGTDTSKQISRYDVTSIINKYVNDRNLHHPAKKKRIICDEGLLSLFGRKTIAKIKIYDMLGTHFPENQVDSDDDSLFSSEEDDGACERQKLLISEIKTPSKKKVVEAPKSHFAAIIPDNINLIYLKKSLVMDLLKDPETFERKIVGSIVKVKSDPNDYLQKNSHMLVQVTGLKKACGPSDKSTETVLQVSNFIKDVNMSMLSDDNFSKEECEDLRQRIRDGLLKRPTIVELEEKVQVLHKDITNHWLVGELALLQKLIDRANEKGWRRELIDYVERRQLLNTPDEQSRLLHEVPKVIPDEIEVESTPLDFPDNSKKGDIGSTDSTFNGDLEIHSWDVAAKETPSLPFGSKNSTSTNGGLEIHSWAVAAKETPSDSVVMSFGLNSADFGRPIIVEEHQKQPKYISFKEQQKQPTYISFTAQQKRPTEVSSEDKGTMKLYNTRDRPKGKLEVQVIELSDDDEEEDSSCNADIVDYDPESSIWHYADPQGTVQGPFSMRSLKRWYDNDYFPPDFKVWKMGQTQNDAALLKGILQGIIPR